MKSTSSEEKIIKKRRLSIDTQSPLLRIFSIVAFLMGWYFIGVLNLAELPTPIETLEMFYTLIVSGEPILGRTLQTHTTASLIRVIEGSAIGFAVALPLGILMGWSKRFERFADTMIEIFRPIPPLAWIPLAFVLFRSFDNTRILVQIFIVFIGAFFPAVLNTIHGVKSIDSSYIESARTFGSSDLQILEKVVLPGAMPSIITGIRIGLGIGWMCVVAAEMIGGSASGIGFFIWSMYELGGGTAEIISGMIAIGAVGYIMNEGILYTERRLIKWR